MIYTVVLDKVLMMGARQMQVKIVSGQYERISALIQEKLDRGVTLLYIEGGHSGQPSEGGSYGGFLRESWPAQQPGDGGG